MSGAVSEQFVTILFADLVGSAALFARHGDEAADALRRAHLDALRAAIAEHDGREIRSTGDGLMVTFASTAAALHCAVAMQHATTGAEERLPLRVGVDAGEPVAGGDELYGTPVIVAEQLCDIAEPGDILATDVVCRVAAPRLAHAIAPAGALKLRGVDGRVPASRVLWRDSEELAADPPDAITTVIVDDERLLRTGFRVILEAEPDITVIGEAEDGRAALDLVRRRRPDVVLMDIRMPELDGLQAAEQLLADPELDTAVIMLTTFDLDRYVYDALRVGASGFLLKDTPADRLLDAVRIAAAGDALLSPQITRRLIAQFTSAARVAPTESPPVLAELTEREVEVLRLIARGLSNAEIAAELTLTENTIKTHVAHVLSKLGLRDRVQAVVLAYESGLVVPG